MDEIINIDTIVKNDIYKLFQDSVICPICKSILVIPMICLKCQKTFCQKCIDDWSKTNEKCPNQCSEPNYQKSIGKNDILSKLKFKCKKCGGEYYYHEIRKHNETCNSSISSNSNNDDINNKRLKNISISEVDKLKKNGAEITYITSK